MTEQAKKKGDRRTFVAKRLTAYLKLNIIKRLRNYSKCDEKGLAHYDR